MLVPSSWSTGGSSRVPEPRVLVLHLCERRDEAPVDQGVVDSLNEFTLRVISGLSWRQRLLAAGDAGVKGSVVAARRADAILVMGGEDVHPQFYDGAEEYPGSGHHDPLADEAQLAVVQDAARRGVPLLGICRGHQLVNVASGSELIPHLPTTDRAPRGSPRHRRDLRRARARALGRRSARRRRAPERAGAQLASPGGRAARGTTRGRRNG